MELAQFLAPDHVCTNVESRDRDEAVHEILDTLVEADKLDRQDVELLLRRIVQRETLGTTAIGRRVAVPHARLDRLEETIIGVGLSEEGVEFHALDGEPVRAMFLVLGSEVQSDQYVDVLKSISEMIQTEDFRRFLFRAKDRAEVVDLMNEMAR